MKHLNFFIGKGGVGKSTLAVLHALYLARQSKPVQLISLDPAHNIYDIFGTRSVSGLDIEEIDLDKWLKKYIKHVEETVLRSYRYITAFNLEKNIKILRHAPAVEEYALILALQNILKKSPDNSHLLFDMPPTALALKFFNLPSLSLIWIDTLINLRSEILKKREMITQIKLGKNEVESDKVLMELIRQKKAYIEVMDIFRNKKRTKIQLVTNPDHLSITETHQILKKLNEIDLSVYCVFINKVPDTKIYTGSKKIFPKNKVSMVPLASIELVGKKNLDIFLNHAYNSMKI